MKEIGDRLKLIRELSGQDQKTFGLSLGVSSPNTIYRWEKGNNYPPADVLLAINQKYGINLHWLVTGNGPMRAEYGEREGKEPTAPAVQERPPPHNEGYAPGPPGPPGPPGAPPGRAEDQGIKLPEAVAMAVRVLESGTSYATALFLNIQHFDRAIRAEMRIQQLEHNLGVLNDKIGRLEELYTKLHEQQTAKKGGEESGPAVQQNCA